jgi:uncharacterized protein (TIGR02996 family)
MVKIDGVERKMLDDILAEPREDTPRLLLADYLEDAGQAERAEFIRLQIDLACMPVVTYFSTVETCLHDDPKVFCYQCQGPRERVAGLLRANSVAWTPPEVVAAVDWTGWPGGHFKDAPWRFRRGFVEWVNVTARCFHRHAKALFGAAPVLGVSLHDKAPGLRGEYWYWRGCTNGGDCSGAAHIPVHPPRGSARKHHWVFDGHRSVGIALEALSGHLVSVGRALAGLPELREVKA